jgi:fluoride exporter
MDTINGAMWVAFGSLIGGTARFWVSGFVARRISGAFLLGMLAASAASHGVFAAEKAWQFAAIGILGTYTTVSSFSLQTLSLARDGDMMRAAGNIVLSLSLCLVAVAVGFATGARAFG